MLHYRDPVILPGWSNFSFTWLSTEPDNVGLQISSRLSQELGCLNPFRAVDRLSPECWSWLCDRSILVLGDHWLILGPFWDNRDRDASQALVDIVGVVPSQEIGPLVTHFWVRCSPLTLALLVVIMMIYGHIKFRSGYTCENWVWFHDSVYMSHIVEC